MHLNTNSFRYYSGFRSMVHATLDFQSLPPWRRVPNCPEGTKRLVLLEPWQHHSVDTLGWRNLQVRLSKTTAFLCSSMMFYVMMEIGGVKTCDLPWLFTVCCFFGLYIYISCSIMFYHVLSCSIMLYHVLSCSIMFYHVLSDFTLHRPGTHEVLRQVHDGVFQGHLAPQWLDRSPWSPSVKTTLPKKFWYIQVWRKHMGHHWTHIGVVVVAGGGVVAGVGVGVVVVVLFLLLLLIFLFILLLIVLLIVLVIVLVLFFLLFFFLLFLFLFLLLLLLFVVPFDGNIWRALNPFLFMWKSH